MSYFQAAALIVFVAVASAQLSVQHTFPNVPHPVHRQPVVAARVVPNAVPRTVQYSVVHAVDPVVAVVEPNADNQAQVLRSESVVNPDSFQYEYETSNGIAANEAGQLKQFTEEESAIVSQGAFRYTAPDGTPISVQYVADENGYHPTGDHLPVSPPIPDYIGT